MILNNPHFDELKNLEFPDFSKGIFPIIDYESLGELFAHDPSIIEVDGEYYVFSTDTLGTSGYQIRKSSDLIHWQYVGEAFDLKDSQNAYKRGNAYDKYSGLQPAYDWCKTGSRVKNPTTRENGKMSFWAPHVIKGTDGKFWLYFALTGYFGGSLSCIGLCKSDKITGPYFYDSMILQTPAGWKTPNAIDPQAVFDENGGLWLVYGSYGMGLYIIQLDESTGRRKDGFTYEMYEKRRIASYQYYGTNVAVGSIEGGVIEYHKDVPVYDEINDVWTKKNFYYLMCSYGSLNKVYNIRCGRSERITGPYVDVNGNTLVCSTDIGTGNKLFGSHKWEGAKFDFFCPGHNDMEQLSNGVNVISYHCRTHKFVNSKDARSKKMLPHYLFINSYTFNAEGHLVINPNRYAGEQVVDITEEELLKVSNGKFEIMIYTQGAEETLKSEKVVLHSDGTITGDYDGTWKLFGGHYIHMEIFGELYSGVVMPAWICEGEKSGLTITALNTFTGMALHMNTKFI